MCGHIVHAARGGGFSFGLGGVAAAPLVTGAHVRPQALLSRINAAQRTASGLLTISPARAAPGADSPLTPGGPFSGAPLRSAFSPLASGGALGGGGSAGLGNPNPALPPRGAQKALGSAARLAVVAMASAGPHAGADAERDAELGPRHPFAA